MKKQAIKSTRYFSNQMLEDSRQQGDQLADNCIQLVFEQVGITGLRTFFQWLVKEDFDWKNQLDFVQKYFQENAIFPSFYQEREFQRGLDFAQKHQADIALMLGCLSLPYCYAGADGARVLWMSERIGKDTRKRLEETGSFVFGVLNPKQWKMSEAGIPIAMLRILKVRLMHASIRFFTLHHQTWNAKDWGLPVNQEDMAGTNLAFSYIVIVGMRKNNLSFTDQEAEAYLHTWNVINAMMGVEIGLLPQNLREAFVLAKAIAKRQFRTSEEGVGLTKSLLKALEEFIENPLLKTIPSAFMRHLLGKEVADLLQIPNNPLEERLVPFIPVKSVFGF